MTKSLEDKIRERAYDLWEQDGRVHGRSDEHWLKASLEVIGALAGGELAHPSATTAAPVHAETQTTVDAAGVVTPKRRPAAKKPAAPAKAPAKAPDDKPTPPASPRRRAKPSV
jgi:hypothetical protein